MTRLTNSVQRQFRYSVSSPPSSSPIAPPAPATAPYTANARFRSAGRVKVVVRALSAAGASSAPNRPCSARPPIRMPTLGAIPASAEATPNPTNPPISAFRRPNRSANRPPTSSSEPNAKAYAVTIHCREALVNPRSCCAEGSAMVTTVASSTTINCARLTTPRIIHSWATRGPFVASSAASFAASDGVVALSDGDAMSVPSWATRSMTTTLCRAAARRMSGRKTARSRRCRYPSHRRSTAATATQRDPTRCA